MESRISAQRSVRRRHWSRFICSGIQSVFSHEELEENGRHIDELHCIPNIQEGSSSHGEPRDGRELYDIDAYEKCFMCYVAYISEDRSCSLCYALDTTKR
jgi:hypothetical protein